MTARFDHLAIACEDLAEGAAALEAALGVALAPGGRHAAFGTHNRLLSLGPGEYLEVIAADPDADPPPRPRWFDLDRFTGAPRLVTWVARVPDLSAVAAGGRDQVLDLSRGAYRWRMAGRSDGRLIAGGAAPPLIEWQGAHPADALPDAGCRLTQLVLRHPDPDTRAALPGQDDPRLTVAPGLPGLAACLATPAGEVWL